MSVAHELNAVLRSCVLCPRACRVDRTAGEVGYCGIANVMDQYRPTFRARQFPEISRHITRDEHLTVVRHARSLGLRLSD